METKQQTSPRRGRPPKQREDLTHTRELLLRAGLEILTEKGFSGTGIDEILGRVGIPKGSFYHYFKSKEAFGLDLIDHYARFFAHKLDQHLLNTELSPVRRLHAFVDDATVGMARFDYRRGCLIGNLGQEMGSLPESFRERLRATFEDWQRRFVKCLEAARKAGELSEDADTQRIAAFFWIGWEGAVLRSKLDRSDTALNVFADSFFASLPTK